MSKLYFKYGTMGSSKTAQLLMSAYNYKERGKDVIVAKTIDATRDGNLIKSRIGLESPCISLNELLKMQKDNFKGYSCVLIDEVQFATKEQIDSLSKLVDKYQIPVLCYGLKTDFTGQLFEGSKRLLEIADEIEELKAVCHCGKAAKFNAKVIDGKIIKDGNNVDPDAEYVPLCRKHYFNGNIGNLYNNIK